MTQFPQLVIRLLTGASFNKTVEHRAFKVTGIPTRSTILTDIPFNLDFLEKYESGSDSLEATVQFQYDLLARM